MLINFFPRWIKTNILLYASSNCDKTKSICLYILDWICFQEANRHIVGLFCSAFAMVFMFVFVFGCLVVIFIVFAGPINFAGHIIFVGPIVLVWPFASNARNRRPGHCMYQMWFSRAHLHPFIRKTIGKQSYISTYCKILQSFHIPQIGLSNACDGIYRYLDIVISKWNKSNCNMIFYRNAFHMLILSPNSAWYIHSVYKSSGERSVSD